MQDRATEWYYSLVWTTHPQLSFFCKFCAVSPPQQSMCGVPTPFVPLIKKVCAVPPPSSIHFFCAVSLVLGKASSSLLRKGKLLDFFLANNAIFRRNFFATGSRCKKVKNYFQVCRTYLLDDENNWGRDTAHTFLIRGKVGVVTPRNIERKSLVVQASHSMAPSCKLKLARFSA